jgi:hypothetical protein
MTTSVYQRVLGADFDRLDPALRVYFGPIPSGAVGVGEGVYRTAGSRHRWLRPVLAVLARRRILFPERAHDVPFTVENRPDGDALRGSRAFRFAGGTRWMCDRMTVRDGRLVDRLGRRGGLEVTLDARLERGGMRLRSHGLALRVGGVRLPLPHLVAVAIDEDVEAASGRQRIDAVVRMPLLGEVFRYTGTFTYRVLAS